MYLLLTPDCLYINMVLIINIRAWTYVATATILAGVAITLINLQLTVCASISWSAGAGIAALSGVGAGGAISTGFVVGAVVEVLVTEEASPALLAHTLPWLRASPM